MRFFLSTAICFFLSEAYAIQNGQVPGPDHPASGNAVVVITPSGFCSGSIIAEDLVLTAAHCLGKVSPFYVAVYFATPRELVYLDKSRLDQDRIRGVSSFEIPEDFQYQWGRQGLWGTSDYHVASDIAVLKLAEPMPTSVPHDPNFQFRSYPVYLGDEVPPSGELVDIAGYGLEGPRRFADQTYRLTVGVLKYHRYREDTGHHLLSRFQGVQACFGDSGGPLYFQVLDENGEPYWTIAGITGSFAKWHDYLTPFFIDNVGCTVMRDFLYFSPNAQRDWLLGVLQKYGHSF